MDLKSYIQGKRHGKEANRMEREAMNQPFLQDAIDGFDTVNGEHLRDIESLEKEIAHRIKQKKQSASFPWQKVSIAASILLLVGLGSLFLLNRNVKYNQPAIAMLDSATDTIIYQPEEAINTEEIVESKQEPKVEKELIAKTEAIKSTKKENKHISPSAVTTIDKPTKTDQSEGFSRDEAHIIRPEAVYSAPVHMPIARQNIEEALAEQFPEETKSISPLEGRMAGTVKSSHKSNKKTIQGQIIDEDGEPLIGASVNIEGTDIGTITDYDGNYKLTLPDSEKQPTLIASFIGYETKKISEADTPIIQMEPDQHSLSEVVVTGYGRKTKTFSSKHIKFGKEEFEAYFEKNRKKELCNGEKAQVTLSFRINDNGWPENIKINKSSCLELEEEVVKILQQAPQWSIRGNVKLKIVISESK